MTNEQFNKYKSLKTEIEPLKEFLEWCGKKYRCYGIGPYPMRLIKKKFRIGGKGNYLLDNTRVEIPIELQDRIIDVRDKCSYRHRISHNKGYCPFAKCPFGQSSTYIKNPTTRQIIENAKKQGLIP